MKGTFCLCLCLCLLSVSLLQSVSVSVSVSVLSVPSLDSLSLLSYNPCLIERNLSLHELSSTLPLLGANQRDKNVLQVEEKSKKLSYINIKEENCLDFCSTWLEEGSRAMERTSERKKNEN
jgi:hypothetical protein